MRTALAVLAIAVSAFGSLIVGSGGLTVTAQDPGPEMLHPRLGVRTVASGLTQPTTMAFIGPSDVLVLEKASGQVKRVTGGVVGPTVLDLAVNFGSERGLLGIALHPDFPADPGVYLYWTESLTGADTNDLAATPLLGNRVDRFVWNGATLTMDQNLIRIRAIQEDAGQPARGNHDGGVMAFGPDEKLYIYMLVSNTIVDRAVKAALDNKRNFNEKREITKLLEGI